MAISRTGYEPKVAEAQRTASTSKPFSACGRRCIAIAVVPLFTDLDVRVKMKKGRALKWHESGDPFPRIFDQPDAGTLAPTGKVAVAVGLIIIVYGYQCSCTIQCWVPSIKAAIVRSTMPGELGALEAKLRGWRRSNEARRNA